MKVILAAIDQELASAWHRFCGDLDFVEIHQGSILEVSCDAVVSPANSFGFMDGGIDAQYSRRFGPDLQTRLKKLIADKHHGELIVGTADLLETSDDAIPYVVIAPTMRVPMVLSESVTAYLATRAALLLIRYEHIRFGPDAGQPISDKIHRLAFPGMGTGVGQMGRVTSARQMRAAIDDVLRGQFTAPRNWAEASERHQLLYTNSPRRLQY